MVAAPHIFSKITSESIQKDKARHSQHPPPGKPLFSERKVRIICIGAGASGLCFAYKLQRSFQNFELRIYEKNPAVSGTWWENTYPGCACDVPAHNYTFSWEPSGDTTAVYVSSQELFQYFDGFATKYNLHKYVRLEHQVIGSKWNGNSWDVDVQNRTNDHVFQDQCDILINASGILNNWKWPEIPGLNDFKGKLLHSANWNPNVDLHGKTVGLIGNGSSGIQILPAIQPEVDKVVTFIRGATWISPVQGLDQHNYTEEERRLFRNEPSLLTAYRKMNETSMNCLFGTFIKGSGTQLDTRVDLTKKMETKLNGTGLESKLIPQWSPGCRRLTPGINYLEALGQPNVQVVAGEISRITETGCIDKNGVSYQLDVLICATGFDVSFKPRFPIVGLTGDLQDQWAKEAKSYLGTAVAGVPNYMVFLGPNCPIGNGPVLRIIEVQADYMLHWIDRWQTENIRSFSPKMTAVDDFVAQVNDYMKYTVWTEDCRSWYKNGTASGRVTALWPGSSLHFMETMEYPRHDDFDVTYTGNRFSWMGNGYSQTEMNASANWAYYIRDADDSPAIGKSMRRIAMTGRDETQTKESGTVEEKMSTSEVREIQMNGPICQNA